MIIFRFRKWWVRTKYIAVFVILTFVLYELFRIVGGWIEPAGRYREPVGKALKVFSYDESVLEPRTAMERLLFFYNYGE